MFRLGSASMALAALVALGGCSSISMAASPSERVRAAQLPVYMAGQNDAAPAARGDLGSIEGYACKPQRDFPRDVRAQQAEALDQLRLRAVKAGADGVIGVRFSAIETDRRNQCFHGLAARGEAVSFSSR
jgi:hypothetical protein